MSSLWYANTIGGKRRRRHMGPFLINSAESFTAFHSPGTSKGNYSTSGSGSLAPIQQFTLKSLRKMQSDRTPHRRGVSVPASSLRDVGSRPEQLRLSNHDSQNILAESNSGETTLSSSPSKSLASRKVVIRAPIASQSEVKTNTVQQRTPAVVRQLARPQPQERRLPAGAVESIRRQMKFILEEPNRISISSAPPIFSTVSTNIESTIQHAYFIPVKELFKKITVSTTAVIPPKTHNAKVMTFSNVDLIKKILEKKDSVEERQKINSFQTNTTDAKGSGSNCQITEQTNDTIENYEKGKTETTRHEIIVAVEPPTSASATNSSTTISLDALCEHDEHSPLLDADPDSSSVLRKSACKNFRFFRRRGVEANKSFDRDEHDVQIAVEEKAEHASTSASTFSDERMSLNSLSAAISMPKGRTNTALKRCWRNIFRPAKSRRIVDVPKRRKNAIIVEQNEANKANNSISPVNFQPKYSSSSADLSRHTSSVTSCSTRVHPPTQRLSHRSIAGEQLSSVAPANVPPFCSASYARFYLPHHQYNRSYSPSYYTTSRKVNRTSRMTQGPQRYYFFSDIVLDFCARTSSHGIPFIGTHSFFGRIIWTVITVFAFLAFCIQTYFTLYDYLQYRTIIEMQLKFEPAPFPAATLCNLNSFKYSELQKFEEIGHSFKLWEEAISKLDRNARIRSGRVRRHIAYRPVYARCVCTVAGDECVPQRNELDTDSSVCICFEDAHTGDIWPCYAHTDWSEKTCHQCSNADTCEHPDKPIFMSSNMSVYFDAEPTMSTGARNCICQSISHYCLARKPTDDIKWWNPHNYTVFPATEFPTTSPEIAEAFGLKNLYDRGAITTRTKENLIFMVAAMPRETRRQLSYTLDEFVLRCSFNSKDCDLERDFQIQIDPEYGNCYTFNFNDSVELKNSRAGPMYGLRLLLNVNQSDYMPTTEAAGVRLVVHEQDQEPFPDTFGYSAPTGFVSSFGLKTKVLNRLDAPYGKCSDTFRPEGYIYAEHYSLEGCYRNCFQQIIIKRCGCGDPRFPMPLEGDVKPCDARAPAERACLANETSVLGGFHHLTHDCHCTQPCTENAFETAYSAAAWPALNFKIGEDCASVIGEEAGNFTQAECTEYYRRNTAYIEIYYEQLNFEYLKETAGYTMVNLFSDLGGNIGLWIGFSLITVLEFIEFFCECIAFGLRSCLVKRLLGRSRTSSPCTISRARSRRNGRMENYSAQLDNTVELGHDLGSIGATAALDCQNLTLRRGSSNKDRKHSDFYYYYNLKGNSAMNKKWRRRAWEQQHHQWEEWYRQQEHMLLLQQHFAAAEENSAKVLETSKQSQVGASFAQYADKIKEANGKEEGSSIVCVENSLSQHDADTLIPIESSKISNMAKILREPDESKVGTESDDRILAMNASKSINLMRFEKVDDDDEPKTFNTNCLTLDPADIQQKQQEERQLQQREQQRKVQKMTAPLKPPVSESRRMYFS